MKPNSNEPIDKRLVVSSVDDLILESTWLNENGDNVAYAGMMVGVEDGKAYILKSLPVTNFSNWERLVSYSIGDTVITETNVNPSADLGGTWELYGKDFKEQILYQTYENANATVDYTLFYSKNIIDISLIIIMLKDIPNEGADLGGFQYENRADIGIIGAAKPPVVFRVIYGSKGADISSDWNMGLFNRTTGLLINEKYTGGFIINVTYNKMLDDFCDKFYWRGQLSGSGAHRTK